MALNHTVVALTTRLILGFLFFFQGFGKVFTWGIDKVYEQFFQSTYEGVLPEFLLQATAYYTSYIELIAGALLIIGFQTRYACYALASVLIVVAFGHGLSAPIWDEGHILTRLILLVGLLLIPANWDRWSVDGLIRKQKKPLDLA